MTHKITRRNFLGASGGAALLGSCGNDAKTTPVRGEALVRDPDTRPRYGADLAFQHGVASGDPDQNSVVIWTRVTPMGQAGDVIPVSYGIFLDAQAETPVGFGVVKAERRRDFCVKVLVEGLEANTTYYYRFIAKAAEKDIGSTMGRTRTLPVKANEMRLAAVSCGHYGFGYFNAYQALADDKSIDVVVHLGDYIYEYGSDGYGGKEGVKNGRVPIPNKEITTLEDYRARYAQYRSDANLQAAHAAHPWICNWDDHETANDAWATGAKNHSEDEGAWLDRKSFAMQAYLDWMPIRESETLKLDGLIYRSFDLGDLATLICLETRLTGRSEMISWEEALSGVPFSQMPLKVGGVMNRLLDEGRTMMGPSQEAWVSEQIAASVGSGKSWQILANQTLMASVKLPNFTKLVTQEQAANHPERIVRSMVPFSQLGLPYNLDAWDGFPAARERLYADVTRSDARLLTLTGDSHTAWVNSLEDKAGKVRGVEFATTSITSPGMGRFFETVPDLGSEFMRVNDVVKWHKAVGHGYCRVTLTKETAKAEFVEVSDILSRDYSVSVVQTAHVQRDNLADITVVG